MDMIIGILIGIAVVLAVVFIIIRVIDHEEETNGYTMTKPYMWWVDDVTNRICAPIDHPHVGIDSMDWPDNEKVYIAIDKEYHDRCIGWWVRGHWRDFKGIGKDRNGVRRIKGKTWVVPHTKKDELGVVDKLRKFKLEEA